MSLWRKEAFERFPEYRKQLQENKSPYGFFHELTEQLNKVTAREDDDVISRIYDYAKWCFDTAPRGKDADDDIFTVVVVAFYEDLFRYPAIVADIHRWLSRSMVVDLKDALLYHGSEDAYQEILSRYDRKRKNA